MKTENTHLKTKTKEKKIHPDWKYSQQLDNYAVFGHTMCELDAQLQFLGVNVRKAHIQSYPRPRVQLGSIIIVINYN